jgi:hypothetical protein
MYAQEQYTSMKRVQVLVDEAEQEQFRRQAEREGLSLSAWLRRAGHERLGARQGRRLASLRDLKAFFRAADERETGREPDWEEHEAVIARSRASGQSGT